MMSKIYVAGPMRGVPDLGFPAFDRAAKTLRDWGWDVVSPAEHDREEGLDPTQPIPDNFDLKAAFRWDFLQIMDCDAIYLLMGWENSEGARAEEAVARLSGKVIYHERPEHALLFRPEKPADPIPASLHVEVAGMVRDQTGTMRTFGTGATRDTDTSKLDFEGFLSAPAMRRFAEYMHRCRVQSDGKLRDADNWQKGIPVDVYMKSMWRHFFAVWEFYRECKALDDGACPDADLQIENLCALMFNVQGMLHEFEKQSDW